MARSPINTRPLRPLLLGHRGARGIKSIPENTLPSFDRALAEGCNGFEFDVRLTADGQAVICHDPRSGGMKSRRIEIARSNAAQLPRLLRLADVLDRYPSAFLDIELKVPGLEAIVIDQLHGRPRETYVVSSFLPPVLQALHAADATIPLGLICETGKQLLLWSKLPLEYVIPHQRLAGRDLLADVHLAGKKVLVWTVNSTVQMRHFSELGVDGIISDHAKRLAKTLATEKPFLPGATSEKLA
jgi:glycerophosphoryl diester phosphodiesterase